MEVIDPTDPSTLQVYKYAFAGYSENFENCPRTLIVVTFAAYRTP